MMQDSLGSASGFDSSRLVFDRDSKACIPHYSIKNSKLPNLMPFFSPDKPRNSVMRRASQQPGQTESLKIGVESVQSHTDIGALASGR